MKITHLAYVHTRYDTRIFLKEYSSLTTVGNHEVNLVVVDSKGMKI